MEDRMTRDFWAGVIAGIPMVLFNFTSHYFLELIFLHFDAIVIYGRPPAKDIEQKLDI